jgi:hypothetical protein
VSDACEKWAVAGIILLPVILRVVLYVAVERPRWKREIESFQKGASDDREA